jgi:CMP-N,N'-diacetyllegionaminic acid synthase
MTKILGLIPARGGSKRLPRKNVKDFLGRPLISWTIEQAKRSRLLDKVVVSTDDEEIAEVARIYGAEVPFLRPGELAKDNSPTIDAVIHTLDWFEGKGEHFDIVAIIEPTSPLRKDDDIDKAAGKLIDNMENADCIVSVGCISHELPFFTMKVTKDGYIEPFSDICTGFGSKNYANQKIEDIYFPFGGIYISKNETLRKYGTIYQKRLMPHFVEKWQNYEMDDIYDYLCIEAVAKYRSIGAK